MEELADLGVVSSLKGRLADVWLEKRGEFEQEDKDDKDEYGEDIPEISEEI